MWRNVITRWKRGRDGERGGKEGGRNEERLKRWPNHCFDILIYPSRRRTRSSPLWLPDDVLILGSLLRQSNATDSSERTGGESEHEDVVPPSTNFCMEISTLFRLQFHVASSVGIIIFVGVASFVVNRPVLHLRTELKRHQARRWVGFSKSLLPRSGGTT